ncbi:hypothetical protein HRbin37_00696 [bacterium HR37]|jgi:hypothetical protein|nr:hypothetical protein HRbin37_00696 [bacterium HR37]
MKATRRGFIKTLAFGVIGSGLLHELPLNINSFAEVNKNSNGIEIQKGFVVLNSEAQRNMEALAETLVPGSKKIGIKELLMNYVSDKPGIASFFDAGLWNLDAVSRAQFKKPFYQLENKEEKEKIVKHISVKNKTFFDGFRETVIKLYYSNPEVWKKLSYNGPPQPRGFMDYSLPPVSKQ